MEQNGFSLAGTDLLKKSSSTTTIYNKQIFVEPKKLESGAGKPSGGGKSKSPISKKASAPELEPELIPDPPKKEEPKVYDVIFSNPRWSVETGAFLDTVTASVDVVLPAHLKRNDEAIFKVKKKVTISLKK